MNGITNKPLKFTIMKNFINTLNKKSFKKIINYHLNGRGKVKRIGTFNAELIIFEVVTPLNNHLFSIEFCNFQSADVKNNVLRSVWSCNIRELKHIINEVNFFNLYESDRVKMNYPKIELK